MRAAAVLALVASLLAFAEPAPSGPVRWWTLPVEAPAGGEAGKAAIYRTLDEAREGLGQDKGSPLDRVDFEKFMVLRVGRPSGHEAWAILSCEPVEGGLRVRGVASSRKAKACQLTPFVLLVPRTEGEATVAWEQGDVAAQVKARDCRCKDVDAAAHAKGVCQACGRRVEGALPLGEEK